MLAIIIQITSFKYTKLIILACDMCPVMVKFKKLILLVRRISSSSQKTTSRSVQLQLDATTALRLDISVLKALFFPCYFHFIVSEIFEELWFVGPVGASNKAT